MKDLLHILICVVTFKLFNWL